MSKSAEEPRTRAEAQVKVARRVRVIRASIMRVNGLIDRQIAKFPDADHTEMIEARRQLVEALRLLNGEQPPTTEQDGDTE